MILGHAGEVGTIKGATLQALRPCSRLDTAYIAPLPYLAAIAAVEAAATQLAMALLLKPAMALLLLVVWLYLAAMSKEFFVRQWLQGKAITYMLSGVVLRLMFVLRQRHRSTPTYNQPSEVS